MPKKNAPVVRETVDGYLSRGGAITKCDPSLTGHLDRLTDAEVVELVQGAGFERATNPEATPWYVPDDVISSIEEELNERDFDVYNYED